MSQFDLLIPQNVAESGLEFIERKFNLSKGGLLSADANHVPTVLPAGTDGQIIVYDSAEVTGLKAINQSAGHTQGTDDGTTAAVWHLDSDGHALEFTAESASKYGLKVSGGATYADVQAKDATFAKVTVSAAPVAGSDLANKTYVDGILAANDAMIYQGPKTIAELNALTTYNAGWTYRVTDAGTCWGQTVGIGDLATAIVDRAGSGNANADWTFVAVNNEGTVIGPASVTDNVPAVFDGTTGKLIKAHASGALGTGAFATAYVHPNHSGDVTSVADGAATIAAKAVTLAKMADMATASFLGRNTAEAGAPEVLSVSTVKSLLAYGSMAAEAAADYVTKATLHANTLMYAVTDHTPAELSVTEQTIVGRKTGGNIAALTPAEVMNVLFVGAPATATAAGTAGNIAYDANYWYLCVQTGTAGNAKWTRHVMATTWAA
jgi:hypothetical protein